MVWVGPDRNRYTVTLLREPVDTEFQTLAYRRDDGWTGATRVAAGLTLLDLPSVDLEGALHRAAPEPR